MQNGFWRLDKKLYANPGTGGPLYRVDINAENCGIIPDWAYVNSASVDYSRGVIIENCEDVNIEAAEGNCVFAGGDLPNPFTDVEQGSFYYTLSIFI